MAGAIATGSGGAVGRGGAGGAGGAGTGSGGASTTGSGGASTGSGGGGTGLGGGGTGLGGGGSASGGQGGDGAGGCGPTSACARQICRDAVRAFDERTNYCWGNSSSARPLAPNGTPELCPDLFFAPGSNRTPQSVLDCMETIRTWPCTDVMHGLMPSCLPDGSRAAGSFCAFGVQCQSGICAGSPCGVCTAVAALGAACNITGLAPPCHTTDACENHKCVARSTLMHGGPGAACELGSGDSPSINGCAGDLDCISRDSGPLVCTAQPSLGETCSTTQSLPCKGPKGCAASQGGAPTCMYFSEMCGLQPPCKVDEGLCDIPSPSGVCRPRPTEGQACNPSGNIACVPGTTCVPSAPGASSGTCTKFGGSGDGCSTTKPCWNTLTCVAGKCAGPDVSACN